jgi:hypothetical protein
MRRSLIATLAAATLAGIVLAGCATAPLPDGSRILRAPEADRPAAPLTPAQAQALAELNARILREQDQALARDQAREVQRAAHDRAYWSLYYGFGWPYWSAPYWGPPHWGPRGHWSLGLGVYGPWP